MTRYDLGLDLGGSRSKWHLLRGGQTVGQGDAPPVTAALLGAALGQSHLWELALGLPVRPQAVHAGLPGYSAARPDATQLRRQLSAALQVPETGVRLESDLELAFRSHLLPGEGTLLYAGTGSLACHLTREGDVIRSGGHGFHIDDDGAGYWLGRAALRWVTAQLDQGEVPAGPLAEAVSALTGGLDWDTLRAFTYRAPGAGGVAALAPAVGLAADQGDRVALTILAGAADALGQLVAVLGARVGSLPVVATGGALRVSPLLPELLAREIPGVTVQFRDHARFAAQCAAGIAASG